MRLKWWFSLYCIFCYVQTKRSDTVWYVCFASLPLVEYYFCDKWNLLLPAYFWNLIVNWVLYICRWVFFRTPFNFEDCPAAQHRRPGLDCWAPGFNPRPGTAGSAAYFALDKIRFWIQRNTWPFNKDLTDWLKLLN